MADKNRSHGKIDNLPDSIKDEVNKRLLAGDTYKDVAGYLASVGCEVSHVGVHRYGREYLKHLERLKVARDFSRLIAEDNVDRPATELHEANNALISHIIMEAIIDEEMSSENKIKAARSVATLQSAQIRNEKLKIEARKAAGEIHSAMNVLKAKVFERLGSEHPEIAEAIVAIADDVESELANAQNVL